MKKVLMIAVLASFSCVTVAGDILKDSDVKKVKNSAGVTNLKCDSYEKLGYIKLNDKPVIIGESIFKENKIYENSKLVCMVKINLPSNEHTLIKREDAVIDGVKVSTYHSGGTGTIGDSHSDPKSWKSSCHTDAMTDDFFCAVSKASGGLSVAKNENGYQILIGNKISPNDKVLIRFGHDKPLESDVNGAFSTSTSGEIIDKLQNSKKVSVRYTQLGKSSPVDEVVDVSEFKVAREVLDHMYQYHK